MKFKDLRKKPEGLVQQIQEGTWQIPKTMEELQKLSEMLYMPYPAKNRRKVLQFQKTIPMGDDHMYDVLDDVGMTDERRLQKWDEPVYINVLAGKALEEEGWIKGRVTNNDRSYTLTHHGFPIEDLTEVALLKRKKGNLKPLRKMLKLERVKDGKVDPLSPMGKSKLTGQEVAKYYRDNPRAKAAARDPQVKKAIEIALDLGGNQTMAMKEIEKLKRGLSRNREVMNALRHANESFGEDAVERAKELADLKAKHKREIDQEKRDIERTRQQTNENVRLSRPAKGQRTLTIDFSKAPNPKKAKDKTMSIAKKHGIKTGKPKKPQSKDDVEFTGSKKAMTLFGREFNLAGRTGLLENKEKLSPAKKQYYDFNVMKTKLYRFVKAKTKAHKFGIDDLMLMTSPKVIEGMYKQNPRGFTRMLDKMYPNEKEKMTKMDFTVLGDFVDARGKVQKGQGDKVDESTELQEGQTYKSLIQGLEKDKKEVASKSKAFRQNDTKYIDKAINFLKMLEKEGIPAGQIGQVDFVTNRVPKFFIGPANRSPSLSKFTPNDVKKAVAHAKKIGIIKESTELNEETMLYRVKDIQKPELDKFKSSARLMKLKINIKQSPRGKETLIRLQGSKKQINDFDAVVRGKSSYGDPSKATEAVSPAQQAAIAIAKKKSGKYDKDGKKLDEVLEQLNSLEKQIDLIEQSLLVERQFRLNPNKKPSLFTQWFSRKNQRDKRTRNMAKSMYSPEDVIEYHFNAGNLKPGKNIVKDTGASVLARSLGKVMNDERKKARDKGAEFGKGRPQDEMDAPKIKKIIDTIAKGLIVNVTRKGKDNVSFTFDKKQGDLFYNLDTYTRDIVWDIMQMGSDGTFYQAVYGEPEGRKLDLKFPDDDDALVAQTESTELNEESQTMKKVRQVIKKKSMMNVDGMKLDLTTASMIASVYDQVNPQNKKRMDSLKLPQLVKLTMKVAGKMKKEDMTSTSSVAMPEIPLGRKHKVMKRKDLEEGYGGGPKLSKAQIAKMKKVNYTPVDECSDEENFKPHMMYDPKTGKGVMAKKYSDHVALGKKGYTHDKPKVNENRAKRDAMRDMGKSKDKEDDGYGTATDDDRKAADKNVIMQIRRVADLPKGGQIELPSGKKVKMDRKSAIELNKKFNSIRKPQDKLKLQKMMNDKKISVVALKRLLGK